MESKHDSEPWTSYDEYVVDLMSDDELVEHFQIQGPGPPSKNAVNNFQPPPPIPGDREECLVFSSHFDTCSNFKAPSGTAYPHLHLMSVIVAICCVIILVSCIVIFLIWKRRQKKTRLAHLQYRLSDSANFDYLPTRRLNKYYNDYSIRNQMEDCGVFYTSALHPVYEEIPTPVEGEYQLLNSEYSTLPYSESFPMIAENRVSMLPGQACRKPTNHRAVRPHQRTLPLLGQTGKPQLGSKTCDKRVPLDMRQGQCMKAPALGHCRGGGMKTLDSRLHSHAASDSSTYQSPHFQLLGSNQNDFLPREAWTDFSGSEDWMEAAHLRDAAPPSSRLNWRQDKEFGSRANARNPSSRDLSPQRRLLSSQTREISPTLNSLESSDVTLSTSSSETYPKCTRNDDAGYREDELRNLS